MAWEGRQRHKSKPQQRRHLTIPPTPSQASHEKASQAAFRSTVPIGGRSHPPRLSKEQELGVVPSESQVSQGPGPGQYDYSGTSFKISQRRSPQFIDGSLDRFGRVGPGVARRKREVKIETPGPGAYLQEQPRETAVISSAVFMSNTTRGESRLDPVPGPAYYSPSKVPHRKTYHLNAVQRWMPS